MTLEEMFAEKPELLEEPLVKQLIEYVKERHAKMNRFLQASEKQYNDVIKQCMYSEVVLINGIPSKKVIENILDQYGKS